MPVDTFDTEDPYVEYCPDDVVNRAVRWSAANPGRPGCFFDMTDPTFERRVLVGTATMGDK